MVGSCRSFPPGRSKTLTPRPALSDRTAVALLQRRGLGDGFVAVAEQAHGSPKAGAPVSEPAADYPVFVGDTLVAELLVNEALAMTDEERTSFGLDDVVGRLAGVQEDIWIIGRDIYRALGFDEDKLATLAAKLPASPDLHGRTKSGGDDARSG